MNCPVSSPTFPGIPRKVRSRAVHVLGSHQSIRAGRPSTARGIVDHLLSSYVIRAQPWLMRQALRLCRDRADAQDLVQEALVRFTGHFASVTGLPAEHHCDAWLIRTMTNLFYDQCRKRAVEKRGAADPSTEKITVAQGPTPKPGYDAITDEQFAQAVHALSPALRRTIELRMLGRSFKEIAALEGIAIGAVGKRLYDARARLKALLEPYTLSEEH